MRVIYKYPFSIADAFTLRLPVGAKILSVQLQDGQPTLWAMVDPREPATWIREFRVFWTGRFVPDATDYPPLVFLATIQMNGLVWHLFEALPL